jgi:hypothetical protein
MELERIERALREGPVDEPLYEPGAFRPPRARRRLTFASAIGAALVLGVVIGVGLDVLRQQPADVGNPPVDLDLLGEELSGSWTSGAYTRDDFVSYVTDAGYRAEDIDRFLAHDPIPGTVRWGLDFDGRGRLVIFRTLDDTGTEVLVNMLYELQPDGRLRWVDGDCSAIVEFTVDGDQLSFGELEIESCAPGEDDRIAMTAFFDLASPYRSSLTP